MLPVPCHLELPRPHKHPTSPYPPRPTHSTRRAEFYGREYALFKGGTLNNAEGAPAHLADLLRAVDGAKRRSVVQHLAQDLVPVIEKGLVDPPLVHRCVARSARSGVARAVHALGAVDVGQGGRAGRRCEADARTQEQDAVGAAPAGRWRAAGSSKAAVPKASKLHAS